MYPSREATGAHRVRTSTGAGVSGAGGAHRRSQGKAQVWRREEAVLVYPAEEEHSGKERCAQLCSGQYGPLGVIKAWQAGFYFYPLVIHTEGLPDAAVGPPLLNIAVPARRPHHARDDV